jgi:hypothetical protein
MKVGSLVKNKTSHHMGIVVRVTKSDVEICWFKFGRSQWSRYSHNLEVLCK